MGRRPNLIADPGPIGKFATALVELKDNAPRRWSFRTMAGQCHYSHAVLAAAAAGKRLPTWEVVQAFVTVLGVDAKDVEEWKQFWKDTQHELGGQHRKLGDLDVLVGADSGIGRGRLWPVSADLAEPAQTVPRPETVRTFEDLAYQLTLLRIHAGSPSLRTMSERSYKPDTPFGSPVWASRSTLSEIFSGKRIPAQELFMQIVDSLLLRRPLSGEDVKNAVERASRPRPPERKGPPIVVQGRDVQVRVFDRDMQEAVLANVARPPDMGPPSRRSGPDGVRPGPDGVAPRLGPDGVALVPGRVSDPFASPFERSRVLEPWRAAWAQAEFNRLRPDLTRSSRYGKVVLVTPEQDAGPTAGVLAAMEPRTAAALLGSLPEATAARLIALMPGPRAQAIVVAMDGLYTGASATPPNSYRSATAGGAALTVVEGGFEVGNTDQDTTG